MATSAQMINAGIADVSCTFALIYLAWLGDQIWKPILTWYYSFPYSTTPVINPGQMTWVYPVYYGLIIAVWFAVQIGLYLMVVNRSTNVYQGDY